MPQERKVLKAGELIMANLNLVLGNDITTPVAIGEFDKIGLDGVFDKAKVALFLTTLHRIRILSLLSRHKGQNFCKGTGYCNYLKSAKSVSSTHFFLKKAW